MHVSGWAAQCGWRGRRMSATPRAAWHAELRHAPPCPVHRRPVPRQATDLAEAWCSLATPSSWTRTVRTRVRRRSAHRHRRTTTAARLGLPTCSRARAHHLDVSRVCQGACICAPWLYAEACVGCVARAAYTVWACVAPT
eukprot:5090173-Prymnesium_polylepis.2